MLYTIAVILLVLWLLGMVSSYTMGGFIHILLVFGDRFDSHSPDPRSESSLVRKGSVHPVSLLSGGEQNFNYKGRKSHG